MLILFMPTHAAELSPADRKASLVSYFAKLDPQIATVFAQSQKAPLKEWQPQAQQLLGQHLKSVAEAEQKMLNGESFSRGEIETEQSLNQLMLAAQLRVLSIRIEESMDRKAQQMKPWFKFAADFPFEESTVLGLRTANVLRSLFFDEVELVLKNNARDAAASSELSQLVSSLKLTYPVDRMLLSESRRFLNARETRVMDKVLAKIQKNPYQSLATLLKEQRAIPEEKRKYFSDLWKDSDIQMMKEEVNRLGQIQMALAAWKYEKIFSKKPASVEDLVKERLLVRVPLNYLTSKPMSLSDISHLKP